MSDKFTPTPEMVEAMITAIRQAELVASRDAVISMSARDWLNHMSRAALTAAIPMIAEECAKAAEDVAGGCHGEPDYQTVTEACAAAVRSRFGVPTE